MLLYSLIFITASFLFILLISKIKRLDGQIISNVTFLLILVLIFGWGFAGFFATVRDVKVPVTENIEVIKKKNFTVVLTDKKAHVYYGKEAKTINDSTSFYYLIKYNIYGLERKYFEKEKKE